MSVDLGTRAPARTAGGAGTDPPGAPTPNQARSDSAWLATGTAAVAVALASLSLSPLLAQEWWLTWPLLALIAVAVTGGLLARAGAPMFAVPLAQTGVGLVILLRAFVPEAPWGFLPSPDALTSLQSTLQDGVATINEYAAPVPLDPGLVALVTLGVGVAAMVTHVLAVTLRAPALAGIPLVAMYVVPAVTLPDGAPWWSFVLVASGWLALLLVDSRGRVQRWGHIVPRPGSSTAGRRHDGWAGAAARLGAIATLLALLVPPLLPGLGDGVLGGHGTGQGTGTAKVDPDTVSLNPFVSMRRDLQQSAAVEVLTYETDTASPAYLRTTVADSFDGENWLPQTFSPEASAPVDVARFDPPGLTAAIATTPVRYQVSAGRLSNRVLPLPYPITALSIAGEWFWDTDAGVAFSPSASTKGAVWQATGLQVTPTVAQLQQSRVSTNDSRERAGALQARIPASLTEQAQKVTAGMTTPYEQALALQWWFRDNFTYSLEVKGDPNADQLTEFLRDRVGYCQQFAATMALMARSLKIPARVAVGFTPGTRDAQGFWHVTTQDAHAWPELYFTGVGWVRFEPTPRAAVDGGNVAVPRWAPAGELERIRRQSDPAPIPTAVASSPADPSAAVVAGATEPFGDRLRRYSLLTLALLALALAAAPAAVRVWRRRTRLAGHGAALAEGGWAELRDTVRDLGGSWPDSDTPRQGAARIVDQSADPATSAAVSRLARAVERVRYAPGAADVGGGATTTADVHVARAGLTQQVPAGARWRARLLPASVLRRP